MACGVKSAPLQIELSDQSKLDSTYRENRGMETADCFASAGGRVCLPGPRFFTSKGGSQLPTPWRPSPPSTLARPHRADVSPAGKTQPTGVGLLPNASSLWYFGTLVP